MQKQRRRRWTLRKFVSLFGSPFTVGKEARLQLAERLMEDTEVNSLLEAEQQLTSCAAASEDRRRSPAGRSRRWPGLNTRKGLLEDAAYYYELLNREYAKVMIRDGKTGADIYNDLATEQVPAAASRPRRPARRQRPRER